MGRREERVGREVRGDFAGSCLVAHCERAVIGRGLLGVRQFFDDLDLVVSDYTVTTVDQAIGVNLTVDDGLSLTACIAYLR